MNEPDKTLREGLLNMEAQDAMQAEMPRELVRGMLDAKLTVAKRIGFALLVLVGLLTAIGLGGPAFDPPDTWDHAYETLIYRLFAIFAFLLCVVWVILTAWAAAFGVIRRTHRPWIVATTLTMGFIYLVLLVFVFLVPVSHQESLAMLGTQMALIGFFLLNMIGLCVILGVLYRGQFKSQEKLLEIEYRIADLAEKMGQADRSDRAGS